MRLTGPIARKDTEAMEAPDRCLARHPGGQRTYRGSQQPDQDSEACRLRVHQLPELSDPVTALRQEAQLGSAQVHRAGGHPEKRQAPLIAEEPDNSLWDPCDDPTPRDLRL